MGPWTRSSRRALCCLLARAVPLVGRPPAGYVAAMDAVLQLQCAEVDLARREARRDGSVVKLTTLEAQLLELLAREAGRPVSRDRLLVEVWGFPRPVRTRAVDNTVSRLRGKLERDPAEPDHLKSVRGVGYLLELDQLLEAPPGPVARSLPLAPASRAFGLQARLGALAEAWDEGVRAVAIVAPGGAGKSRLALRWAEVHAPHALWLSPGTAPERSLAAALEVAPPALPAALAALTVPLVLDEVEGCLPALAALLPRWLVAAPELRVLLTSRRGLGLSVVRELRLAPLPLPAARALFLERLRRAAPGRALSLREEECLDAFIERQDGSPLALELAAAQAAVAPVHELLARRERGGRGGSALPGPLEQVLEDSYAALGVDARAALVALGGWRAPMTLSQLAAVLDRPEPAAGAAVRALLAAGLARSLSVDDGVQLRVLDAVRTMVVQHWSKGPGLNALRCRQNDVLMSVLESVPADRAGRARLAAHAADAVDAARELEGTDPLRAARLVLALYPHLRRAPPELEVADLAVRCAAAAGGPVLRARALLLRSRLAVIAGQVDRAAQDCAAAAGCLEALPPDAPGVAGARAWLAAERAAGGELRGDHAATLAAWTAAVELAEQSGDPHLAVRCQLNAIHLMGHLEGPEPARRLAVAALRRTRRLSDPELGRNALVALATTEVSAGRYDDACETMLEALAAVPQGGGGHAVLARGMAGWMLHLAGRLAEAEEQLETAVALARAAGIPSHVSRAQRSLALVALETGALARAWDHLLVAQEAGVAAGMLAEEATSDLCLALVAARQGRESAARRHRDAADAFFGGEVPAWYQRLPSLVDAQIDLALGRPGAQRTAEAVVEALQEGRLASEVVMLRLLERALEARVQGAVG